jgi:hypothetical protein
MEAALLISFGRLRNLQGCCRRESIPAIATYYKPSQWRGKRLVYQSIDPEEPKREAWKIVRFLFGGVISIFATIWIASIFAK